MFIYTVSDIVFMIILSFIFILLLVGFVVSFFRTMLCKHTNTFENRSCDEICKDCDTNLGFIGRNK